MDIEASRARAATSALRDGTKKASRWRPFNADGGVDQPISDSGKKYAISILAFSRLSEPWTAFSPMLEA